jgi:hypothetical protein
MALLAAFACNPRPSPRPGDAPSSDGGPTVRRPDILERAAAIAVSRPELAALLGQRTCFGTSYKRPLPCWGDEEGPEEEGIGPRPSPRLSIAGARAGEVEIETGGPTWRVAPERGTFVGVPWIEKRGERIVFPDAFPDAHVIAVVKDRTATWFFFLEGPHAPHDFVVRFDAAAGATAPHVRSDVPVLDGKHEARAPEVVWDGARVTLRVDPSGLTYPLLAAVQLELVVAPPPVTPEPVAWTETRETGPGPRGGHAMAYDTDRRAIVLFGGHERDDDVWEYDGSRWRDVRPLGSPWRRLNLPAVYHAATHRTVFFGGADYAGHDAGDTWTWDGRALVHVLPPISPPGRSWSSMAYDENRKRVVLFGGRGSGGQDGSCTYDCDGTWEWDGTAWKKKVGGPEPSPRWGAALAFDRERRRVVLFGGASNTGACGLNGCNDTWEWDGTVWVERKPRTAPTARYLGAMAYDRARKRIVLFGGAGESCPEKICGDTWEWDGSAWNRIETPRSPPPRSHHAMVFDETRRKVVLYGGEHGGDGGATLWEWDGVRWTAGREDPPALRGAAMAWDEASRRVLMFGGESADADAFRSAATWAWNDNAWHMAAPGGARAPSPRRYHAMAADTARKRVVLFGGDSDACGHGTSPARCGDTWIWSGSSWTQATPPTAPSPRYGHAMAYDEARGRIVLYGGASSDTKRDAETWEWDGDTWSRRLAESAPGPREWHKMVYDRRRKRVILYDGSGEGAIGCAERACGTVWEWDGETWTRASGGERAPQRRGAALAYHRGLDRVVLFGGSSDACEHGTCDDLWVFEGTEWRRLLVGPSRAAREGAAVAWDDARAAVVLYGGIGDGTSKRLADTWILR